MRPTNSAKSQIPASKSSLAEASVTLTFEPPSQPSCGVHRAPALRPIPVKAQAPRRFARVPTHAVGVHPEQREYPRATLKLPLKLRSVDSVPEEFPVTLVTRDISSTGVYFLCPKQLTLGASLELQIVLVSRPMGRGNVVLTTRAQVQRFEPASVPGWFGIAASFDDVEFDRDDCLPYHYHSA